jgi:hypothetical protein
MGSKPIMEGTIQNKLISTEVQYCACTISIGLNTPIINDNAKKPVEFRKLRVFAIVTN